MIKYRVALFLVGMATIASSVLGLVPPDSSFSPTGKAAASATFNAGHIIDDNIFTNNASLSTAQIQKFLDDMMSGVGGCYAAGSRSTSPPNGACINQFVENTSTLQNNFSNPSVSVPGGISAAQIIYNAAQDYRINPEVLLVTLQKEQGLITDNWPWYIEYQHAMGYSCPDTAACSSTYEDFYKQVEGAAWQYRYYLDHPGAFNYWLGVNNIAYAPSPCTSSSAVNIVNAATAALYIYTPYQPDSNVLSHTNAIGSSSGPGSIVSGDSCATYGNRNFWWYFNSWFGPTIDTSVSLAQVGGDNTIYVLYDGKKQGIPSLDVLDAWGLNGLPVTTLDSSVFNSIPTDPTALTRYGISVQNNQLYFADNGNIYYAPTNDALTWNFNGQPKSSVSSTLINFANFQGEIKPFVYVSGNPTIYMVDNGTVHAMTSGAIYGLWAGPNYQAVPISGTYLNGMPAGTNISNPLFSYAGTNYVLSDGRAYSLSSPSMMPSSWVPTAIGQGLYNSLPSGGTLQYMVKDSSPTVYLLDGGTKKAIPDPQTYYAYQKDGTNTTLISTDLLNLLPAADPVHGNIVSTGGQYFVVNHSLQTIPVNLYSNYNLPAEAMALQTDYRSILGISSTVTPIVGTDNNQTLYYLDNDQRMPFSNPYTYGLLGGTSSYTYLLPASLGDFTVGPVMSNYISNSGGNYLIDINKVYSVTDTATAQAWQLSNPIPLSNIGVFNTGGALSQHIQTPSGFFCLLDSGTKYCAGQPEIITIWDLLGGVVHPSDLLLTYQRIRDGGELPRFANAKPGTQYGSTIFTAAQGELWGITSPDSASNLGYNGRAISLSQATIDSLASAQPWQGYLAYDDNGALWALDGGYRRSILSSYTSSWQGTNAPTQLGTAYLNLLPINTGLTNSIYAASSPTVYGMRSGQKYAFTTAQSFASSGLPNPSQISVSLLRSIPTGGTW